jgi:hypothetical protein
MTNTNVTDTKLHTYLVNARDAVNNIQKLPLPYYFMKSLDGLDYDIIHIYDITAQVNQFNRNFVLEMINKITILFDNAIKKYSKNIDYDNIYSKFHKNIYSIINMVNTYNVNDDITSIKTCLTNISNATNCLLPFRMQNKELSNNIQDIDDGIYNIKKEFDSVLNENNVLKYVSCIRSLIDSRNLIVKEIDEITDNRIIIDENKAIIISNINSAIKLLQNTIIIH